MTRRKSKPVPPPSGSQLQAQAIERYRPLLNAAEFDALLSELQHPLPPAIRINTLKVDVRIAIGNWSQRYAWEVKPVPYCDSGWQILSASAPVSQTIEHRLGYYYIQDAASMLPVELFNLEDNDQPLILDLAASPGGKTTHITSRTGDRGLVIANDASLSRLPALRSVLQNWGAFNIATTSFPGEQFGDWFPECFDKVLLDAPCSMENLRSTASHPMRAISPRERQGLAQRQARLLSSAFKALRPGGELVYSTCTLSPEEDEAVVDSLLKMYPGIARISRPTNRILGNAPALVSDGVHIFDSSLVQAIRLWPQRFSTSGFFSVLITKTASLGIDKSPHPQRLLTSIGLSRVSNRRKKELINTLYQHYGFDLAATLTMQNLELWERSSSVYAFPNLFIENFSRLPFQSLGLLIGEELPDGFSISHEFCSRFGTRFTRGQITLPADLLDQWLSGEDVRWLPESPSAAPGFLVVMDEQKRLLGRGRLQKDRIKNMLPRRLF